MVRPRRPDAYLLELAVGLGLLALVNVLIRPADPGFLALHPNPAIIVVAILAARWGLREGLVAATITGALVLGCWLAVTPGVTPTMLRSVGTYLPVLPLLAAGFVLGAIAENRRRTVRRLESRVRELEGEMAEQAVHFMAASEARHELERRVAEERESVAQLYTAAQAMETLDLDKLYPAIVSTTRRFLRAEACQLYLVEGGHLRLGVVEGDPPARSGLALDEGVVGLAISRGAPASIRDFTLAAPTPDQPAGAVLLAAPLVDRTGTLLGCLTVTRLPFVQLTPAALDRLRLVADWASRTLENARAHEDARAHTIEDELMRAYTYAYYQRRLREEEARADRFGRPLCALVFRIREYERVPAERRAELGRVLSLVFSRTLRDVDLVCRYATPDAFAILLPETSPAAAETVAARLTAEIRNFHFAPYGSDDRELEFSVRVLIVRSGAGSPDRGQAQ